MQVSKISCNQATPSFGSKEKIAKDILNGKISKLAKGIEFDGLNMPFGILMTSMFGGVFAPRLIQAQDKYDREEIFRRDLTSILTMVFGEKILSKMFAKHNEKKSGFVLTNTPADHSSKSVLNRVFDYIRPAKGINPLHSGQIISKYSNLKAYKDGAAGFCEFIDKQGGDLKKLFSFTDETKNALETICGKEAFNKADNKGIISAIKDAMANAPEKLEDLYKSFEKADNSFVKKAKSMNSQFGFLSMFLLVPALLGFGLPWINSKLTKKKYTEDQAQAAKTVSGQENKTADVKNEKAKEVFNKPGFMAVAKANKSKKAEVVFSKIDK